MPILSRFIVPGRLTNGEACGILESVSNMISQLIFVEKSSSKKGNAYLRDE